jgi:hypothetical protein
VIHQWFNRVINTIWTYGIATEDSIWNWAVSQLPYVGMCGALFCHILYLLTWL